MAGCSISVTAVDAPLLTPWDATVHTAALRWKM
jgi:phosphoenolpyruvate---glycerone phosphotransferase subunit DhaK